MAKRTITDEATEQHTVVLSQFLDIIQHSFVKTARTYDRAWFDKTKERLIRTEEMAAKRMPEDSEKRLQAVHRIQAFSAIEYDDVINALKEAIALTPKIVSHQFKRIITGAIIAPEIEDKTPEQMDAFWDQAPEAHKANQKLPDRRYKIGKVEYIGVPRSLADISGHPFDAVRLEKHGKDWIICIDDRQFARHVDDMAANLAGFVYDVGIELTSDDSDDHDKGGGHSGRG
ncbi:MAG: hypothetical protein ACOYJ2_01105 [Rickettsiales bacterium]